MTPPIQQFYKNQNIFLTGGTGFMGRITVEKLLRSFPDIGKIFMLIRPKKGITVEERKNTYFDNSVFDRLINEQNIETFSQKLHWIEGDITKKNLGLSETIVRRLQNEIYLLIHGAAELRFHLPLKFFVEANLRATYELLKIADGCKHLQGFMYVSTVYCQVRDGHFFTPETVLKIRIPMELIKMAEEMSGQEMEINLKTTLQNWMSYYSFSKNCAENLCAEFSGRFPIAIFRPAIGFPRALMEANRGYVLICDPKPNTNMVPVDLTINAMLAVMRQTCKEKKIKVYNCTTNNHPCSASDAFRYYSNSISDYETVLVPHRYRLMEMHNATPGSIEDKMRQKLKEFHTFSDKIGFMCAVSNFTFANDNNVALWRQMSAEDKALLPVDVGSCNWKQYYSNMVDLPTFEDLHADPSKRDDIRETFLAEMKSKY